MKECESLASNTIHSMQRAVDPVLRAVHRPYLPLSPSFTIPSRPHPPLLPLHPSHTHPNPHPPIHPPPHHTSTDPPMPTQHPTNPRKPNPKKSQKRQEKAYLPSSELLKALLMVRIMRVTSRHPQPADGDAGGEASSSTPLHARCRSKAGRGSSGDEARRRPGEAGSDCERHLLCSGAEAAAESKAVVGGWGDGGWVERYRVAMVERS